MYLDVVIYDTHDVRKTTFQRESASKWYNSHGLDEIADHFGTYVHANAPHLLHFLLLSCRPSCNFAKSMKDDQGKEVTMHLFRGRKVILLQSLRFFVSWQGGWSREKLTQLQSPTMRGKERQRERERGLFPTLVLFLQPYNHSFCAGYMASCIL